MPIAAALAANIHRPAQTRLVPALSYALYYHQIPLFIKKQWTLSQDVRTGPDGPLRSQTSALFDWDAAPAAQSPTS